MSRRKWIDPQDFRDLRRESGLTRVQAAEELNVTTRTIQNWETGGARIPWMAYRMLRILRGYALPCSAWEGWELRNHQLFSPNRCRLVDERRARLLTGSAVPADVRRIRTR